jgi:hypothetical protein
MLPHILQHVRELVEAHTSVSERARYKIITPFPPGGPDFADFDPSALVFADPPADAVSASVDTIRAFEFFNRTDSLFYDYSYGIRSDEYFLSRVCDRFFRNAQLATEDVSFTTRFAEKRDAFLNRYLRSTVGDQGRFDFRYTALTPIAWNAEPVVLNAAEVERLKRKAIEVYEDLQLEASGFMDALIGEIRASDYSEIRYHFGSFDVIREWMDPQLFESRDWTFSPGGRALYGENDPYFTENDVKLCFAQRYYLIRSYTATRPASPTPVRPHVRDHRRGAGGPAIRVHHTEPLIGTAVRDTSHTAVDVRRRQLRSHLIGKRVARLEAGAPAIAGTAVDAAGTRPRHVWIPATATVPAHWERAPAGTSTTPHPDAPTTSYKIAAVKCRVIPFDRESRPVGGDV